jgi:hypothetical protein
MRYVVMKGSTKPYLAAGLRDVQRTLASKLLRDSSLEEFLVPYIEASPLAEAWSQLGEQTRVAWCTSKARSISATTTSHPAPPAANSR